MHGTVSADAQRSIFPADKSGGESRGEKITDKFVANGAEWFGALARALSRTKPAATLAFLLKAVEEDRNHQRWAAGEVEPRVSVLAGLLRSGQGDKVLSYVMRECSESWWVDHCRAAAEAKIFRDAIAQREQQLRLPLGS